MLSSEHGLAILDFSFDISSISLKLNLSSNFHLERRHINYIELCVTIDPI